AENGFVTVGGHFSDPGVLDQHTVRVDWGDGSAPAIVPLGANMLTFSGVSHQYLNNPAAPATSYTISVGVTDDDEPLRPVTATTPVVVQDVAATLVSLNTTPTGFSTTEGANIGLAGSISDPGTLDRHQVSVDWGDGSTPSSLLMAAGASAFSGLNHVYVSNPTGQPAGAYTVTVPITDPAQAGATPLVLTR